MRKPFMGRVISLSISVALSLSFAFSCASPASGPESKDYLSPTIGTLKYVSGGTFSRDSFSTNISTVSDFRIGVNAVTQEQYYAVTGWYPSYFSVANGPVETVSWYDAVNFCNLLSAREGLTPYYSITDITTETGISDGRGSSYTTITNATVSIIEGEGYRLPTMMEFYWAAMGGIDDTRSAWYIVPADDIRINLTGLQKSYAGAASSNNAGMNEYVWNASNSDGTTHPVGTKKPNELGLYDMTGNVLQWCWDWYGEGLTGSVTDYRGPDTGTRRFYLGGNSAWSGGPLNAMRTDEPETRFADVGFRVVRQ